MAGSVVNEYDDRVRAGERAIGSRHGSPYSAWNQWVAWHPKSLTGNTLGISNDSRTRKRLQETRCARRPGLALWKPSWPMVPIGSKMR